MTVNRINHSDTALRVLEILKYLIQSPLTMGDLLKKIEVTNNVENVYTREALSKYFATLSLLGFTIVKNGRNGENSLINFPVKEKLSDSDVVAIYKLKALMEQIEHHNSKHSFSKLFEQFKRLLFSDRDYLVDKNQLMKASLRKELKKYSNFIKIIDECCNSRQKIKVEYYNPTTKQLQVFLTEALSVEVHPEGIFFVAYSPMFCSRQKFLINCIKNISYNPQPSSEIKFYSTATFELFGNLRHTYKLQENEQIYAETPHSVTISNFTEDREVLIRRLLRYGEYCKVLSPKDFKGQFMKLVDEMLANYE